MANSIYQGKINRQFWGKLIRQSEKFPKTSGLQYVIWGGQFLSLSIKGSLDYHNGSLSNTVTFFHSVRRIE